MDKVTIDASFEKWWSGLVQPDVIVDLEGNKESFAAGFEAGYNARKNQEFKAVYQPNAIQEIRKSEITKLPKENKDKSYSVRGKIGNTACSKYVWYDFERNHFTTATEITIISHFTKYQHVAETILNIGSRYDVYLGTFVSDLEIVSNDGISTEKSSLQIQEGGTHYKEMKIQPIEYIHANNLPFIEGNIVKYISRHKEKNGAEDIKKVIHYCQLLLELEYGEK